MQLLWITIEYYRAIVVIICSRKNGNSVGGTFLDASLHGVHAMKSRVVKRSIVLSSQKTSVSLEDPFWEALKEIAERKSVSLSKLLGQIDQGRTASNLSSAIRVFVLSYFQTKPLDRKPVSAVKLPPSVILERLGDLDRR